MLSSVSSKAELTLKKSVELDPTNGSALVALAGVQTATKKIDAAEQTYRQASALPAKTHKALHAMFLYQIGRRQEAVAELNGLVKSDPNDRDFRTALVAAYIGVNQVSKAEDVLAAALKRNPKDTDALLQRAGLRLRFEKADDAENDLREVLHFDPNSARAHLALAGVNKIKGLDQLQRQELERTLELDRALLDARLQLGLNLLSAKQAQTALEVLSQAPDYQKHDLRWIVARNWALLSMGNFREAKTGIEQALQQGRAPAVVFQNAVLQYFQRDYAVALTNLDELLKRDATDENALNLMIQVYEAQHDVSKGMERLKVLAAAQPGSALLQNTLGQWYRHTGNATAARKAFEAAKTADPHFVTADLSLAEMDIREGRNDAARQRLDGTAGTNPTNLTVLLLSARADEQAGEFPAAIARYRAVVNIDHSNLIALNNLAYLLAPNDADEALKYAQQAAEKAPADPAVQDTLGWVYYRKGLSNMAVQYLKAAVDKESTPRRQFHLGMSYLKMGDQATGKKSCAKPWRKIPTWRRLNRAGELG